MPAQLQQIFGRVPLTAGVARNWIRNGTGHAIPPDLDVWLARFLAASTRVYAFLEQDRFLSDLDQWVHHDTFLTVLSVDPLAMLRNHVMDVEDIPGGHDTQQIPMFLTVYKGLVRIGRRPFCMRNPNRPWDDADVAEPVQFPGLVNYTPMRNNTSPHRFDPPIKVTMGSFWFTPVQTGCSVLICDWGGNTLSMVHLQPYDDAQYPGPLQAIFDAPNAIRDRIPESIRDRTPSRLTPPDSDRVKAEFKHFALRQNLNDLFDDPLWQPERYILVQTTRRAKLENVVVIGLRIGGTWRFFCQRHEPGARHPSIWDAIELQWRDWSDRVYRSAI